MVPGAGGVPTMQRIPLPGAELLEEEPLYVNAKQYHRILKRRQARAKLEAEGRIPKERRVRMQACIFIKVISVVVRKFCCPKLLWSKNKVVLTDNNHFKAKL